MFSISNLQFSNVKTKNSSLSIPSSSKVTKKSSLNNLNLSPEQEEKIIKSFVNIVNEIKDHQSKKNDSFSHPMTIQKARKFLSARKFEIQRALALYKAHEMIRSKEGLDSYDLNSKSFQYELYSGKFTVLPNRDPDSGCCIALFSAYKHDPSKSCREITLNNILLQLDVCLSSIETQDNGFIFIYNMKNSKYSNFDYELSQKILDFLKDFYPAKLKKVLIIAPPLWFKTSFKILRLFIREKLRNRVYLNSQSQLRKHLPRSCLPEELGGELVLDHKKWINHCLEQTKILNPNTNIEAVEDLSDLIDKNISSLDAEENDDTDDFRKNASELDLSGLSEQLTGYCDKMATDFEQNFKINKLSSDKFQQKEPNIEEKKTNNGFTIDDDVIIHPTVVNRLSLTIKSKPESIQFNNSKDEDFDDDQNLLSTTDSKIFKKNEDNFLNFIRHYLTCNDKSLHRSTDPAMTLEDFLTYLRDKGRKGLSDEYIQLRQEKDLKFFMDDEECLKAYLQYKKQTNDHSSLNDCSNNLDQVDFENSNALDKQEVNDSELEKLNTELFDRGDALEQIFSFETSVKKDNAIKNRYLDVLCYDHTRVKLKIKDEDDFDDFIEEEPINLPTDYINANYVDGYEQKNAFISTQGPLDSTCIDFWEMCIQNEVKVIVMTTHTMEAERIKCAQYWPLHPNSQTSFSYLTIINNGVNKFQDYKITKLTIKDNSTHKSYELTHLQFLSWPDYGVPHSACAMLEFRQKVRQELTDHLKAVNWPENKPSPPIVVHCSAGIGRTGTFITLDISILRLENTGLINILNTVKKIRCQRANSIQMPDQYIFCYLALLEFAIINNMLKEAISKNLEDSDSDQIDQADQLE